MLYLRGTAQPLAPAIEQRIHRLATSCSIPPRAAATRLARLPRSATAVPESSRPDTRGNPQRLDTLVGKILRIIPSLDDHKTASTVSDNGRYRIPNDNPFASTPGARKEIWALGFRNPHRLHWAIDLENPRNNRLIVNSIGLRTWETINIVQRGANYGYSQREGNEALKFDNRTEPRPEVDRIPIQINATDTTGLTTPNYPVLQYPHAPGGGDAIGSGYLYRGKNIPALRGKYVFSDISTGRLGTWTTRSC